MHNKYRFLGADDYRPRKRKVKKSKSDIGIFIRPDGIPQLDLFTMSYNEENNKLIINSRQTKTAYELNIDSVIDFVERFKEVDFGVF